MEPNSHNTFKPNRTLAELQAQFEKGYTPQRRKKQNKYKQMSLFDKEDK